MPDRDFQILLFEKLLKMPQQPLNCVINPHNKNWEICYFHNFKTEKFSAIRLHFQN